MIYEREGIRAPKTAETGRGPVFHKSKFGHRRLTNVAAQ